MEFKKMITIFHCPFSEYSYIYSKGERAQYVNGKKFILPKGIWKVNRYWKKGFIELYPVYSMLSL